jgi:hypothetical protein
MNSLSLVKCYNILSMYLCIRIALKLGKYILKLWTDHTIILEILGYYVTSTQCSTDKAMVTQDEKCNIMTV